MAKFHGMVGFSTSVETAPGVWKPKITELPYSGDEIRNTSRWSPSSTSINDNITLSNQISIISNPFAVRNFSKIKYVVYMGNRWNVESVSVQYPRLVLTLGGVYNGKQTNTAG